MSAKISKMQRRLQTPKEDRVPLGEDIKLKNSNLWDELNALNSTIIDNFNRMIFNTNEQVTLVTNDPERSVFIKDKSRLAGYINMISNDFQQFLTNVNTIKAKHASYSGSPKTPDEYILALSLSQDYIDATTLFESTINDYIKDLSEILHNVETEYSASKGIVKPIDADFEMINETKAGA